MRKITWLILTLLFLLASGTLAQFGGSTGGGNGTATQFSITAFANLATPPSSGVRYCSNCAATNPCTGGGSGAFAFRTGSAWDCNGTGASAGTVTSFSAGTLSPLFTTSVANPTTTPALSFSLTNAAAHTFFANDTGSTGAPSFTSFTAGTNYEVPLTFSTGLTRTTNTITVNASQSITTLSNLTTNGLVTTSGGVGTLSVTVPGTGVLTALGVNVGTAGAFVVNGGALGSPSSAGTIPAFTLGGTVDGGGNQINNVIIGTTTPLAGTFTTGIFGSTTSILVGTAGSAVGNIGFRNATSGTATLAPPTGALGTYTVTLPNAASTLPIYGAQITYTGPSAARTVTYPDSNFSVARTDAANAFIGNQTIAVGQTTSAQTDLLINPTTKASGNLVDLEVNSVSKFKVDSSGVGTFAGAVNAGSNSVIGLLTITTPGSGLLQTSINGTQSLIAGANDYRWGSGATLGWTSTSAPASSNIDTNISRNAAGVVQIGTTAANALGSLLATNATFSGATFKLTGIGTDAAATDTTACVLSDGTIVKGSGTLGICLGTSTLLAKQNIALLNPGLNELMQLRPISFTYKPNWGYDPTKTYYGFGAEEVAPILPQLVPLGMDGKPRSVDLVGMIPVLVKSIQEMQKEIDSLKVKQ